MTFSLIVEDTFYKEESTVTDAYTLRGVYYEGETSITYKSISGTIEPYSKGEESMLLPAGSSSSDAKVLYTSEYLQTYDDTGDVSLADRVYLSDPEVSGNKPQPYRVMNKEDWSTNSGFVLISTDDAVEYLLVKEERAVNNGS